MPILASSRCRWRFLALAPGKVLGAEFVAIFAIFTSQAWNMTYSLYASLRTVPRELIEVADSFRFSAWMRFWRLEVPFAVPPLIWNTMMSMSGGWFFVVASEAILVGTPRSDCPASAPTSLPRLARSDLTAVLWASSPMLVVILLYDQLLFRPLVAWSDRFRFDRASSSAVKPRSWMLHLLNRSALVRTDGAAGVLCAAVSGAARQQAIDQPRATGLGALLTVPTPSALGAALFYAFLVILGVGAVYYLVAFVGDSLTPARCCTREASASTLAARLRLDGIAT